MPRRDPHAHRSDPESTFDTWLDAFVAGTPAAHASQDDPSGPLAGATAGARQLHGLAARGAMPGMAHQRIREDLMQSGALVAPGGGRMWIPERTKEKRAPWWSAASPVLTTAVAIAVLLGLVATLVSTQRPVLSPTPSNAPGLAMASPGATPTGNTLSCGAPGYVPIVAAPADSDALRAFNGNTPAVVKTDSGYEIPGSVGATGSVDRSVRAVGNGFLVDDREDGSATAIRISDGETWDFSALDTPSWPYPQTQILPMLPYIIGPANEEGSDWRILDTRTGEAMTTSEITGEDAGGYISPDSFASLIRDGVGRLVFSTIAYLDSGATPEPGPPTSNGLPFSVFLPGSLDDAVDITTERPIEFGFAASPDGAWFATDLSLYDGRTGTHVANLYSAIDQAGTVIGFDDGDTPTVFVYHDATVYRVDPLAGAGDPVYVADQPITRVLFDPDTRNMVLFTGYGSNERAIWLDPGSTDVRLVPELRALSLQQAAPPNVSVGGDGSVTLVSRTPVFAQPPDTDRQVSGAAYALNMASGTLSLVSEEAALNAFPQGGFQSFTFVQQGFVVSELEGNRLLVVDADTGARYEFDLPAGVSLEEGWSARYELAPEGTCVALRVVDDTGEQVGNTWIAPLAQNATWIELDVQLVDWWHVATPEPPTVEARTLPAQDFGTPVPAPTAPESTPDLADLFIVPDTSGVTPTVGGPSFATMNDKGLTLPTGANSHVTLTGVTDIRSIDEPGLALVTRRDGTEAVIDLTTAAELHEVPPLGPWGVDTLLWRMVPANDALTDWEIIDLRTGERRLLSSIVDLPADTAVMPASVSPDAVVGKASVFNIEQGRIVDDRFAASDVEAATFVIPDRLDLALQLPDYPSTRDATGSPTLAVSDDGATLAYETRAGDDRIVIVDLATGTERMRVGVDQAGDDPSLAGFTSDGRLVASTGDRLITVEWASAEPVATVADGFERLAYPLVDAPDDLAYAEQADTLLRIDLTSGEATEVASGLMPGPIRFTLAGAPWITFGAEDGQALLDARSGEIVSQMSSSPGGSRMANIGPDAAGSTVVFDAMPGATDDTSWILSPEFPDGLMLTGPDEDATYLFTVSRDGKTIYAKQDGFAGVGDLWMAPLATDLAWTRVAEDIDIDALLAIPRTDAAEAHLPAQAPATPVATPQASALASMLPDGVVPVISPEPWGILDRARAGGTGESGLTIPLLNGETYRLPDGASVSQLLDPSIAIVEDHDGNRIAIDLETGETLANLPERSDQEQLVGTYLFTPANEKRTDWIITDLRTGDQADTATIGDGPFDQPVSVVPSPFPPDAPHHAVAQFTLEDTTGEPAPWQGLATDEGPISGTLVIPGDLADARFLDTMAGRADATTPAVALSPGDEPLLAYVRTGDSDAAIVLEHARGGERIAAWSARDLQQRMSATYLAGFSEDGKSLVAWVGSGGYGPDFVYRLTWDGSAEIAGSVEYPGGEGTVATVFGTGSTPLVRTPGSEDEAGIATPRWTLADLDSGSYRDLPPLDGFRLDRALTTTPWVVFRDAADPSSAPAIVDRRTGEVAAQIDDPASGRASALSPSRDFGTIVYSGNTEATQPTWYVLDAERGKAWEITPPKQDGMTATSVSYSVSPDGSLLIALAGGGQSASERAQSETWISPMQPEPEWTSIGFHSIESWLYQPEG